MTRSAKASPPVRSEKFRSRTRPSSRNHRSIGRNNRQHQRIRSPTSGRAQHQRMQWMQWSETTKPLRLLAGRSGQESVNGTPPARIDVVQTGPEEQMAERMRELPTPPSGPTPEPISLSTPVSLVRSSFLKQLETVVKTPFKTPGQGPSFRLPVSSPTPASVGMDTQETPEVSGSIRSADKGTKTTSLAPRVTQSAAKHTPGSSPPPKRAYVSPSKGSRSKRQR